MSTLTSALLRLPRDGSLEAKKFRTLETMNELGILGMKDSWIGVSAEVGPTSSVDTWPREVPCVDCVQTRLNEPTIGLDSYNAWRVSSPSHGTMTGLRSSPFTSPAATSWRSSKLAALVEAYAIRTTVLECGCRFGSDPAGNLQEQYLGFRTDWGGLHLCNRYRWARKLSHLPAPPRLIQAGPAGAADPAAA
ncbi:hypothetical protein B0H14DRAFT_3787625 [Mycena olivaceomarginata]|nr:hypothetical protein B0H14DRAFT_3787625 [Mycena olivaceomarginata]